MQFTEYSETTLGKDYFVDNVVEQTSKMYEEIAKEFIQSLPPQCESSDDQEYISMLECLKEEPKVLKNNRKEILKQFKTHAYTECMFDLNMAQASTPD